MKVTANNKYFLIDTLSNAFYSGSRFVFNIIVFSLLISSFSLNDYGIYIFFATLMSQFEFFQAGFSASLLKNIPIYKSKSDITNLISLVSLVYLIFGLLFSFSLFLANYFKLFDFLGDNDIYHFIELLIWFIPFIWMFKTFSFVLRAYKDYRSENTVNIILLVLEALLVLTAIRYQYKLHEILLINLSVLLLRYIFHTIIFFIRHKFNFLNMSSESMKQQFNEVKSFSFWSFVSSLSGSIINTFDKFLVTIFLGASVLPVYYGINQFIKVYTLVIGLINSSIIPYFSEKISKIDNIQFNYFALRGTSISNLISMFCAGVFTLCSSVIFRLVSKEFLLDYLLIFNIGILLYMLIGSRAFIAALYNCRESHNKILSKLSLMTAVIYPITFIIFTNLFGLNGAILSPIISHLIISPFWFYFLFKQTNLKFIEYLSNVGINFFKVYIIFTPFYLINYVFGFSPEYLYILIELVIISAAAFLMFKSKIRNIIKLNF